MKNFKPLTLVVALFVSTFAFYQCTNDEGLFTPIFDLDFATLDELHDSISSDTVRFQVLTSEADTILEGPQGIRLVFPLNSIGSGGSGGSSVPPYDVELIEIFRRGEMIAQNIQSFENDNPLVSGGMFWLRVTDANGNLQNLNGVQAILPRQTDADSYEDEMVYFTDETQTTPSGSVLSWGINADGEVSYDAGAGDNGEYTMYDILNGWNHSAAIVDLIPSESTQFSVKVPNVEDYSDTEVFFAWGEFTTVAALTNLSGDALNTYTGSIPTGTTGTIIAISLVEGSLYFASQSVTVAGDDVFTLQVAPGTVPQLETVLASLD
ncbi:MAG: hypothetical protein WCY25_00595 [Moheibacter sp.]